MSDERRPGTTKLHGRPLNEDGAIAFQPIKSVELHVINAHALESGKVYIFEIDRTKISEEQIRSAMHYLHKYHGINGVTIRSIGGDGLRVIAPEAEVASVD